MCFSDVIFFIFFIFLIFLIFRKHKKGRILFFWVHCIKEENNPQKRKMTTCLFIPKSLVDECLESILTSDKEKYARKSESLCLARTDSNVYENGSLRSSPNKVERLTVDVWMKILNSIDGDDDTTPETSSMMSWMDKTQVDTYICQCLSSVSY